MAAQVVPFFCWICGKPVDVATCKTDEHGKAVHEACYVERFAHEDAPHENTKLGPT